MYNRDHICINITADGKGIDEGEANHLRSCGVNDIRARVKVMNGSEIIDAGPGKNTSIKITIPYKVERRKNTLYEIGYDRQY
jgi:signal transduction histidine kinase